jgi:hypothetical protein
VGGKEEEKVDEVGGWVGICQAAGNGRRAAGQAAPAPAHQLPAPAPADAAASPGRPPLPPGRFGRLRLRCDSHFISLTNRTDGRQRTGQSGTCTVYHGVLDDIANSATPHLYHQHTAPLLLFVSFGVQRDCSTSQQFPALSYRHGWHPTIFFARAPLPVSGGVRD